MKKLLTTLSIMILLLGATILTSNKAYATENNINTTTVDLNIKQVSMTLTNVINITESQQPNKTLLTFTASTGNAYQCYSSDSIETNKPNINKTYTITMQNDKMLDYTLACKYDEIITYITNSIYNPLTNQYINSAKTENDEIYKFYSDQQLNNTWQVLIIDTKGTTNVNDDIIVNSYNLDGYIFSNN